MSNKSAKKLQAVRGMNDLLPGQSDVWQRIESACIAALEQRGYSEIRLPIIEHTQLFARSIGAETDIVAKEMYTFEDRNGDSLTLRPEGTASCARAGLQHGLFYNQTQRVWYYGPMFRHERPQKGRYRQFYQIGAEAYGWSGADIEAELIATVRDMFAGLQLEHTELQINSLGDVGSRTKFRTQLQEYLRPYFDELDPDSQRRLDTNPLRILDSKVARTQELLQTAPDLASCLSKESKRHFDALQGYLTALNVEYSINTKLVRGLDYYNDTVFEWVNEGFGAQSTVCAGGRYDGLVEQIGGSASPAFGFAMGMERLVQILIEQQAPITQQVQAPQVYVVSTLEGRAQALSLHAQLCNAGVQSILHCGDAGIKNQFKKADRSGAKVALIIGPDEAENNSVGVKQLVHSEVQNPQQTVAQSAALDVVTNWLESL